jgi:hypothetical protein
MLGHNSVMPTLVFESAEPPASCPQSNIASKGAAQLNARARAAAWLTLIFWISHWAVRTLADSVSGKEQLFALAGMRGLLLIFGLALCYLIHLALSGLTLRAFRTRALAAAFFALVAAEIFAWATYFTLSAINPAPKRLTIDWAVAIETVATWTWLFLAWSGLYLALEYSFDVREEEQRSGEIRAHAYNAKLHALRNQVNPHLLFNSLNSVSALVLDGRIQDADRMLGKLAAFFRMTLAIDPTADARLVEELALQKTYLEIEQLRYPDLRVDIDVPATLNSAIVPTLILQPIVENAVKYGVAGSNPPAWISILASSSDGRLTIQVTDSGRPARQPTAVIGGGIGLSNVRERLSHRFGEDYHFGAGYVSGAGYCVTITIPLETSDD